jgi:outer membrane biosynthesis protein TonB
MSASEKKNKRKGIIGTILFHTLLLIAFLFMGLTYQIPPPPEEGISINFGYVDEGVTESEPEDKSETPEPVQEEIVEEQSSADEEIVTQEMEKAPIVEKTEQKKKDPKLEKKEVIEEKKPEVNKKALYTGKKKNKEMDEGNTGKHGNQGVIDGDPNAKAYSGGGIGTDGIAYQLGGRNPEFKAKPIYKIQEEGKVVVIITVDRLGNVVNAIPGAKGSTTLNKYLLAKAKEAAIRTKFNPKQSAPENQQGKIVYHFSLN